MSLPGNINDVIYFDKDADLSIVQSSTVAIIGYGNQGRSQALNLKDSKVNVVVGLREESLSRETAQKEGFKCLSIADAAKEADIICCLVPDQYMADIYKANIEPYLSKGKTILFSHGYNIHYKLISPPEHCNVIMVAPSGPGHAVREKYTKNSGVPNLIAIEQDSTSNALDIALSYSKAIGGTRTCAFMSTFKEETETDLFGEQVILTGSFPRMIKESFKVLLEGGYSPVVAWFVCFYEVKNIVDLFSEKGIDDMFKAVSETAEYGGQTRADRIINDDVAIEIKEILNDIKSGAFHKEWMNEAEGGLKALEEYRIPNQTEQLFNELTKVLLPKIKK